MPAASVRAGTLKTALICVGEHAHHFAGQGLNWRNVTCHAVCVGVYQSCIFLHLVLEEQEQCKQHVLINSIVFGLPCVHFTAVFDSCIVRQREMTAPHAQMVSTATSFGYGVCPWVKR